MNDEQWTMGHQRVMGDGEWIQSSTKVNNVSKHPATGTGGKGRGGGMLVSNAFRITRLSQIECK